MCSIGIIISHSSEGIEFIGDGRVEISCNREDEHPVEGEHWFKSEDFEIKWSVPENSIWLA